MKIAIPDIVSNSYFPAIAAVDLGLCAEEGLDLDIQPIFPLDRAYTALKNGDVDFVGTTAHGALSAFPNWQGAKLLCAQSQGLYWFLVVRADLNPTRNNLQILKGLTIGAAPWADDALKAILSLEGIDPTTVSIGPPKIPPGTSFGIAMVQALRDKTIDGFWANGMAAELAINSGAGAIVLDVRRGDGTALARTFTQPSIVTTDRLIDQNPEKAAALIRAIVRAHAALRADPTLAPKIAAKRFPPHETSLIERLVTRDFPYYDARISEEFVSGMIAFARSLGQLSASPTYADLVATQFTYLTHGLSVPPAPYE